MPNASPSTSLVDNDLATDFVSFASLQLDCKDYDPFHAVLWGLRPNEREERLWLCLNYMAFYSMGSAWVGQKRTDPLEVPGEWADELHIGQQRRNLRASSVRKHLSSLCEQAAPYGSLYAWLTNNFTGSPQLNWHKLCSTLGAVWGNGRWGAYTTAELLCKVGGLPATPCTFGMAGATGPRQGAELLAGRELDASVAAQVGQEMQRRLQSHVDVRLPWIDKIDHAVVESCLCDFYGLWRGNYYSGRDIDRMQYRINMNPQGLGDLSAVWDARSEWLPDTHLGELNGWDGYRKDFLDVYANDGRIIPGSRRPDRSARERQDDDYA